MDDSKPAPEPTPRAGAKRPDPQAERARRARVALLKRIVWVVLGLAAVAVLVISLLPEPMKVDLAAIKRGDLRVVVHEDGRTRVKHRYVVSAPLMANLARIELSPGDRIEAGQVVARLQPMDAPLLDPRSRAQASARVDAARAAGRQAHSTIARARTALEMAKREVARLRQVHAQGAASDRALEQAELEARAAAESLASAELGAKVADHDLTMAQAALGLWDRKGDKTDLAEMELRAPVDGVVLRRIAESAGVVQPGTPLLEIGDPRALELVVDVLTTDAVQIERGARAYVDRWGGEATLKAHVSLIEPSAFTRLSALGVEEQRVNVVLDFDAPPEQWSALGDGYRVEVRIVIWEGKDKLLVPVSAVFRHGSGSAVYRFTGEEARITPVRVGRGNDEQLELLSGLQEGQKVITHPSDKLEDGAQVRSR